MMLPAGALALEPDEVALICNSRVPASVELAKFYAQARGVPLSNIIELSLPDGEQMGAERFDGDVVMPIRKAIVSKGLRSKIKCLLTFYGVPLKLAPRTNRAEEQKELLQLSDDAEQIERQIATSVTTLENVVVRHDPKYRPESALEIVQMLRRAETAMMRGQQLIRDLPDAAAKNELQSALLNNIAQLGGPAALVRNTRPGTLSSLTTAPTSQPAADPEDLWDRLNEQVKNATQELQPLAEQRDDIKARHRLRELTAGNFGLVDLLRIVQTQLDYLTPDGTTALDNELPLLWYNAYTHGGMMNNPLHYRSPERAKTLALMVMRLDGPQSGTARDIILASKAVEAGGGLTGRFAIDSRGLTQRKASGEVDTYGQFDVKLRDLSALLQRTNAMPVIIDTSPDVFKAQSVKNVALYCGWYSVRNYVPAFAFNPGAIGFHIASYEMVSLRNAEEKGWARGMLNDGISSTLGPVDEPYLGAFPDPMDFFPLLLSGKYSLAETYWLTLPTVSWKMSIIGDPLYAPFKAKPAMKVEDLPAPLRRLIQPAAEEEHLPGYRGF